MQKNKKKKNEKKKMPLYFVVEGDREDKKFHQSKALWELDISSELRNKVYKKFFRNQIVKNIIVMKLKKSTR